MTICAVVVTYNRLRELKKCIESLKSQTRRPDLILVINNSSTDGTLDWLTRQINLEFITQPNKGGAGGFHKGIKTAYEKGFDWIWCMDDDGYPLQHCLEELISVIKNYPNISVVGPLVTPAIGSNILSFKTPLWNNYQKETDHTIIVMEILKRSVNNLYKNHAVFFNGVLISKETIEKVGFPEARLFIYGDEIEYSQRIREAGIELFTNIKAHFIHPINKFNVIRFLNQDVFDGVFDWKSYVYIRNRIYIHRRNYGGFGLKFIFVQLLHLIRKKKILKMRTIFLAYYHGIRGNFNYKFTKLK